MHRAATSRMRENAENVRGKPLIMISVRPDVSAVVAPYGQIKQEEARSTGEVAEMKVLKTLGVGVMVVALLIAVPFSAIALNLTFGQDHHDMMPNRSNTGMGGMMSSNQTTPTTTAAADLTIIHVQKGCHVFSNGSAQMPMMRLSLKAGQMLRIMNQDLDMHRMMEVAGPAQMMLGGPMKQGQAQTLTFKKPGVYRFTTKVSPMAGMPAVATTGPDNNLRLMVTVA
jgi:plastocyanin